MSLHPGHSTNEYTPLEAARLCDKSPDTIRRALRAEKLPNAYREGDSFNSAWRIPLDDLVAAGLYVPGLVLQPGAAAPSAHADWSTPPGESERLRDALEQAAWLRAQNTQLIELVARLSDTGRPERQELRPLATRTSA